MNKCYLSLGSNQKSPQRQLNKAITALRTIPNSAVIKVSKFHKTKAWGLQSQQDFWNAAVEINTRLKPLLLLKNCQKIESRQGRLRKKNWGPRTIDIDIIFYGKRRIRSKNLIIPHPYWSVRNFVKCPLNELTNK